MKKALGTIRHLLTFGGGFLVSAGLASEGETTEAIGALCTVIGFVWSIYEKHQGKGSAGASPHLLLAGLFTLAAMGMQSGCARLDPDGAYRGDQVLYAADRTITASYDVLHAFVSWEFENRAHLAVWPGVTEAADRVRANAQRWIQTAISLREVYAASPTEANKTALQSSLAVLEKALAEAARYMAEGGEN